MFRTLCLLKFISSNGYFGLRLWEEMLPGDVSDTVSKNRRFKLLDVVFSFRRKCQGIDFDIFV